MWISSPVFARLLVTSSAVTAQDIKGIHAALMVCAACFVCLPSNVWRCRMLQPTWCSCICSLAPSLSLWSFSSNNVTDTELLPLQIF
ncbi:hypothetical protein GDO81_017444 [Engystomops pustulosus]|uniref:Secreted protein n=1 Tax=Engystomops pustulosus TaxID=76066 RepID=A0AAV7ADY6_ENGPU|nr:hypothetical protein GDO81_017444 [Engystomops pustulosus]